MAVIMLLGLVSCEQHDIFNKIISETKPLKPRIEGHPTNMVVFKRKYPDRVDPVPIMYVASGRLHWYAKEPDTDTSLWDSGTYYIPQPDWKISALAVAEGANGAQRLYALCRNGDGVTALRYIESSGNTWNTIPSEAEATYPVIQSIYADPESTRLFAGATGKNSQDQVQTTYAILYLDDASNTLKMLENNTSLLSGAVYRQEKGKDIYYLSTKGSGIFRVEGTSTAQLANKSDVNQNNLMFMSMIKLNDDTIIAVERIGKGASGGPLYKIDDANIAFEQMPYTLGDTKYATEALTLWQDYRAPDRKLLIAGILGGLSSTTTTSYTHGYVEFELNPDGSFNSGANRHDPGTLLSVIDQSQYTASIGKLPINHLFQAPPDIDTNMTFFASTQTTGLWSYRERDGRPQWNAEN